MSTNGNRRDSGVTLVEVVIAIAVLAVVIVAFLSLFGSAYNWIIKARNKSAAMYDAQEQVELSISEGTPNLGDSLTFEFSSDFEFDVPGAVVKKDGVYRDEESSVVVFVPQVSVFSIE